MPKYFVPTRNMSKDDIEDFLCNDWVRDGEYFFKDLPNKEEALDEAESLLVKPALVLEESEKPKKPESVFESSNITFENGQYDNWRLPPHYNSYRLEPTTWYSTSSNTYQFRYNFFDEGQQ